MRRLRSQSSCIDLLCSKGPLESGRSLCSVTRDARDILPAVWAWAQEHPVPFPTLHLGCRLGGMHRDPPLGVAAQLQPSGAPPRDGGDFPRAAGAVSRPGDSDHSLGLLTPITNKTVENTGPFLGTINICSVNSAPPASL